MSKYWLNGQNVNETTNFSNSEVIGIEWLQVRVNFTLYIFHLETWTDFWRSSENIQNTFMLNVYFVYVLQIFAWIPQGSTQNIDSISYKVCQKVALWNFFNLPRLRKVSKTFLYSFFEFSVENE